MFATVLQTRFGGLAYGCFLLVMIYGWILNLMALENSEGAVDVLFIWRMVGIPVMPLGSFLGLIG